MNECYFCTRDLRRGHWPLCPVLDMSRARRITFFGEQVAAKLAPPGEEDTAPHRAPSPLVTRGFLQGDRLV